MKKLYEEISIGKEELIGSNIDKMKIEYYKTNNESNILKEDEIKYGVEIVKKEYVGEEEKVEVGQAFLCDNEKELNEVIEVLKNNQVMPVELEYIAHDYLYQKKNNIYKT